MASAAISIFFLRFLRESRDRLFGFFAAAFAVLACDWLVQAFVVPRHESQHYLFLIRLLAFALILAGIVDKNRSPS
jgi:hypothetical protein